MTAYAKSPPATSGGRLRVVALGPADAVLDTAEEALRSSPVTVGALRDVEAMLPTRRTLLVPTGWLPRHDGANAVVVLTGRALPLAALDAALAEAARLRTSVVVMQELDTDSPRRDGVGPRSIETAIETAQQENLDVQLAGVSISCAYPGVPVIGEVVAGRLAGAVRHLDRAASLVVVDSDALASAPLCRAMTVLLEIVRIPLLVVGADERPGRGRR